MIRVTKFMTYIKRFEKYDPKIPKFDLKTQIYDLKKLYKTVNINMTKKILFLGHLP